MAGPLKRYGQYFVFAAMATTGVFVWNSNRRDLNGESYAELFNAIRERSIIPLLEGSDTPDWSGEPYGIYMGSISNLFPSGVLKKTFVDAITREARTVASGSRYSLPEVGYPDGSVSFGYYGPTWLLSTNNLFDGSTSFVTNKVQLTHSVVYNSGRYIDTYTVGAPVEFVDGDMTSLSVKQPGTLAFPPPKGEFDVPVPLTNQPLSSLIGEVYSAIPRTCSGFSFELPEEGCAWSSSWGRVAFSFFRDDEPTNAVIKKRDLVGPAEAVARLRTSITAITFGDVIGTNLVGSFSADVGSDPGEFSRLNDCHNCATNGAPYSGLLWRYWFSYADYVYTVKDGGGVPSFEEYTINYSKELYYPVSFENELFDYPSTYAVTNGFVSRIRVFAVFSARVRSQADGRYPTPTYDPYAIFEEDQALLLNEVGGVSFDHPVSSPDFTGIPRHTSLPNLTNTVTSSNHRYAQTKLALIYDKENPSTTNDISWASVTMPSLAISGAPSVRGLGGYKNRPFDETFVSEYSTSCNAYVDIEVIKTFVVVDWNWRHLNPDNPYVPPE